MGDGHGILAKRGGAAAAQDRAGATPHPTIPSVDEADRASLAGSHLRPEPLRRRAAAAALAGRPPPPIPFLLPTLGTAPLPVNTDGGLIANGEPVGASGLRQVHELVRQLRGEAGDRQGPGEPQVGEGRPPPPSAGPRARA